MGDVKTFRGEGGALHQLSVPLGEVYADQVRSGRLVEIIEELRVEPAEKPRPSSRRKATATPEED